MGLPFNVNGNRRQMPWQVRCCQCGRRVGFCADLCERQVFNVSVQVDGFDLVGVCSVCVCVCVKERQCGCVDVCLRGTRMCVGYQVYRGMLVRGM
jgi:hypothetical protein